MLDEARQQQLAATIPLGMNDLPVHLQYRQQIVEQQSRISSLSPVASIQEEIDQSIIEQYFDIRIGVSDILPDYLFENHTIPPSHHRLIILVVPMDYEKMITAPSLDSATEILRSYKEGGRLAIDLSIFIRSKGFDAMVHHPLGDHNAYHHLLLPSHAANAGLGERGRTGLFIDYEYGPTVRLAAVTTNAPLDLTRSKFRGITEFCHRCKYCVRYCPPNALPDGTYLEQVQSREPMDFKINAHRCFQYFQQHNGCGRCIVHCILAEPDKHDIARRLDRITNWYEEWVVSGKLDEIYDRELNK